MSIENIIFEETDTLEQQATKTALIYAGNNDLKKQMERLKINYSKEVVFDLDFIDTCLE